MLLGARIALGPERVFVLRVVGARLVQVGLGRHRLQTVLSRLLRHCFDLADCGDFVVVLVVLDDAVVAACLHDLVVNGVHLAEKVLLLRAGVFDRGGGVLGTLGVVHQFDLDVVLELERVLGGAGAEARFALRDPDILGLLGVLNGVGGRVHGVRLRLRDVVLGGFSRQVLLLQSVILRTALPRPRTLLLLRPLRLVRVLLPCWLLVN